MAIPQQIQFAETIRAMKVAMKRRPDIDSDSDTSIHAHTNRGHKLQRRSAHVRAGHLDPTGGLGPYRHRISHAGYSRAIISTNPPVYDGDGDPFSPTESDLENDRPLPEGVESVEENPFGDVKIEDLLRPLTNPAELENHPGLRHAYVNEGLSDMVEETMERVRRERETLWKAKRLLGRFRGDGDWMPCGRFEGQGDEGLLEDEDGEATVGATDEWDPEAMDGVEAIDMVPSAIKIETDEQQQQQSQNKTDETAADDGDATANASNEQDAKGTANEPPIAAAEEEEEEGDATATIALDGTAAEENAERSTLENPAIANMRDPDAASEHTSTSGKETNGTNGPSHSMTTRARARSPVVSDRGGSPTPSDSASIPSSFVHPWFLAPSASVPDRDLGLPASEAEETRRLLLLYVQKQENVVRSLETLYAGLARTDRLRNEIWRACKAEGHVREDGKGNLVTEMSDGEDWYDIDEWNLQPYELKVGKDGELGLEKGKDEIEDVEEEGRRGAPRRRRVNRM